jgi:hypothetical protein
MIIDYTLPVILWLCSIILPGAEATWVLKGEQGPPLALTRTVDGFHLQPPKGVKAPTVPITIKGTQIKMGEGKDGAKAALETDIARHLAIKTPLGAHTVSQTICTPTRKKGCFDTVSVGNGKAQMIYVNDKGKPTTLNFQRVGE